MWGCQAQPPRHYNLEDAPAGAAIDGGLGWCILRSASLPYSCNTSTTLVQRSGEDGEVSEVAREWLRNMN